MNWNGITRTGNLQKTQSKNWCKKITITLKIHLKMKKF